MHTLTRILQTFFLATIITSCGGGGGGSDSHEDDTSGPTETPGAPPPSTPEPTPDPLPTPEPTPDPEPIPETGNITLSWNIPTTRSDDSPLALEDIGGYELYYYSEGSSIEDDQVVNISDKNTTTYATPDLPIGTYHFAITTYDTNNIYSDLSPPLTVVID